MTEEMIENINDAAKETAEEKTLVEDSAEISEPAREVVFEEALEAILFAAGHPITYATLARVFESTPPKIKESVIEYSIQYNNSDIPRGVILLTYADSCQLCTKKYYLNEIREALGIKKSGTLSTSSMEALAIVAYNQPVTRAFVDTLRRVDSSYAMNNLIDRGLIESKGRLDAPGRPMLYGTTPDFLRAFGLSTIDALPTTAEEIQAMFAKINGGQNQGEDMLDELQIAMSEDELAVKESDTEATAMVEEISYEDEQSAEDDIQNG
ncbi:MAG: SMC-Scp complex subunit ScpB [Ruminococcaceae bacterium]|nr:SMC-Scp complex subunit ScpB [Oscillospiraceae bacterium]